MKYYAGLDVSLKETAVCIVTQDGDIVKEGTVPTDPEPLAAYLKATGLVFARVGLEAGPGSPWLYKGLAAAGLPVFCIETRHAHAALKAQNVKTDRNDARGIAHMMRTGWFKATHVKAGESQKRRVLLNNRKSLAEKRLDLENQIRGTLKVFGLRVGRVTAAQYEPRIHELIADDAELQAYIEPLLEVRRHVAAQCRRLEKMILDLVKQDAVCRRFMTIPGVGPLTALLFKTSIDDPHRFRKSAHVGVHLGLTPRKYASGEVDYDGRITKCGDVLTRTHLYEAAQVLMTRVQKWSTLKAWGMRVAKRSSMKNACVAVARKLAVIMHRMWIEGTEFRYGKEVAA